MATLTEMVAAVVVHSSAAAFSHFGVTVDHPTLEQRPAAEQRIVARTPRQAAAARREPARVEKASVCPDAQQRARLIRA
ncbi:hypothetical protein [Phenylobacterium sp.]|uniref:hypothetical protein n=1 Tax=Phenylobacterium sp. TaxID=1871053 RepID=UPI0025FA619A|nr:hypothetical protein [Phenylobacterium sp.]MBX3483755.1 hypothetical protein [Phenylobacterium sp.]